MYTLSLVHARANCKDYFALANPSSLAHALHGLDMHPDMYPPAPPEGEGRAPGLDVLVKYLALPLHRPIACNSWAERRLEIVGIIYNPLPGAVGGQKYGLEKGG